MNKDFKAILDSLPVGVWKQDMAGKLQFVNRAFCESVGIAEEKFLSVEHYSELYDEVTAKSCMRSDAEAMQSDGLHVSYEILQFVDGALHDIEIIKRKLLDENGDTKGLLGISIDITEKNRLIQKLEYMLRHDELTGLANRRRFEEKLHEAMVRSEQAKTTLAIIFIDLDNFKTINDTLGHGFGDQVLVKVADSLTSLFGDNVSVSRWSGDEFILQVEGFDSLEGLERDVARIIAELQVPMVFEEHIIHITSSAGVVTYPEGGKTLESLIKHADMAMYSAKENGKNTFSFYTQAMEAKMLEAVKMDAELREAVRSEQFTVFYQPQIDMRTKRIAGMEALVRWEHPDEGLIPPDSFIPSAEKEGYIETIGAFVLERACSDMRRWLDRGADFKTVSVNVSGRQLANTNFPSVVESILLRTELSGEHLELEITETILMSDFEQVLSILSTIHKLGVTTSIDDFGTGYSSLSNLKRLPVTKIKIDKSFVHDIESDENDVEIVKAIMSMGHTFGLMVIAEGVETEVQEAKLAAMGIDMYQGYYFSRPLPCTEFEARFVATV